MPAELYIGLMSGTSIDGIDAALVSFKQGQPELLGFVSHPYPEALTRSLHSLCQPQADEINIMGRAGRDVALAFAGAVNQLIQSQNVQPKDITAIGSHGQTIRHFPQGNNGFSLQIGCGDTLACETHIPVICNFRSKDIALGGQGAPLVPAFHKAVFAHPQKSRVVLNIGGIANITYLPAEGRGEIRGWDTGPGNTLMDAWCLRHTGKPYDKDGQWAASGNVSDALLQQLLQHPYFTLPAPKSTGREDFHLPWLQQQLDAFSLTPEDVQATLVHFTATTICNDIATLDDVQEVYVCGGGAFNPVLMQALQQQIPTCQWNDTDALGVNADAVEAIAFAWLAYAHEHQIYGNVPAVTGATREAILGQKHIP